MTTGYRRLTAVPDPPARRPRTLDELRAAWQARDVLYADRPFTPVDLGAVRHHRMDEAGWVEREKRATAYLEAANWTPPFQRAETAA